MRMARALAAGMMLSRPSACLKLRLPRSRPALNRAEAGANSPAIREGRLSSAAFVRLAHGLECKGRLAVMEDVVVERLFVHRTPLLGEREEAQQSNNKQA